jgi:hypothetical protein
VVGQFLVNPEQEMNSSNTQSIKLPSIVKAPSLNIDEEKSSEKTIT